MGAMVRATLGLLAFILAFTFGLAAARFDTRRQVLLDEANAIGTTYLRAGMLPDRRDAVRGPPPRLRRCAFRSCAVGQRDGRHTPVGAPARPAVGAGRGHRRA